MTPNELRSLVAFLVEAKRRTYAGLDDDATIAAPLLPGSKQLEYAAAPYAYRDIYFGMRFFVGQETVSKDGKIIWSMCYSGGASVDTADQSDIPSIYKFLRRALLAASSEAPYRGPVSFVDGEWRYANRVEGALAAFHGVEDITRRGKTLFELRYSGGLLR
ncbi:MAG TPA: DUF5680 domain-containing protein [Rhodoblastus sp.]|nr:DUF5680 domain-containing protein [Rhodoblastus sp.]